MTLKSLYLCQHGDALATEVDPDRPLSARGRTDIARIADLLNGKVEIESILHSGKTRAKQTAELFHERLAPEASIASETGLGPNDRADDFIRRIAKRDAKLLIVSHLPFVSRLASQLLGHGDRDILEFEPGTLAALTRGSDEKWLLNWMLTPLLLAV